MVFNARCKANARLLSAGRQTIDEVTPEDSRVTVYVYAIQKYEYTLEGVDARYKVDVEAALRVV